MNHSIIDPYQGEFPEVIEEYLENGTARCIAFNRRGTLLAAGCTDGSCVIWDFETRGVARELQDKECTAPITCVCWSKCGRKILTSSTNKTLAVWDVLEAKLLRTFPLNQTVLYARFHPGTRNPNLALACPMSSVPVLVDFALRSQYPLEVSTQSATSEQNHHPRGKHSDGNPILCSASASFNKEGDLIYVGNSKGEILIIDTQTRKIQAVYQVPGNAPIKQIVFSKSGKFLLTNSNDRCIRIFKNGLPQKNAANTLKEWASGCSDATRIESLKMVGNRGFEPLKEFYDAINRHPWKTACFSGDDDWVIAAPSSKGEHKICIWDRAGYFVKMLEGPKEVLTDLLWHPIKPLVASVSMTGLVYIWARDYTENWSAFAPDFKELEENEEYVEREDEFDMMPEPEKIKATYVEEDEDVDILENDKFLYSDSDDSAEDLHYLPTTPLPDSPEPVDQSSASPSQPENSTSQSDRSPAAEKAGKTLDQNACEAQDYNAEREQDVHGRRKRKRRLSEKGAEMQAEKGRKTVVRTANGSKRKSMKMNSSPDSAYRKPTEINTSPYSAYQKPKKMNTSPDSAYRIESGSLDSSSKMRSVSKDSTEALEGNYTEEVPSFGDGKGKRFQKMKVLFPARYPYESSTSPTSDDNDSDFQ